MKLQTNAVFRATTLAAASFALAATPVHAVTRTWDGGAGTNIWTTAANWNPDGLPVATDTVVIDTALTVDWTGGVMPACNVTLSNGAGLRADVNYGRLSSGTTINVGPTSTLSNTSGKGWDLNGGNLNFQNGAAASIGDWELKGFNTFSFKLGADGFTKLTPTTLRWQAADKFTKSTWTVDMADYTGPSPASIILVDFSSVADPTNMTSTNFLAQATRTVTNAGANVGSTIVYDPFQMAFVLKVQVAPASLADSVWDGGAGTTAWTTATNWNPDILPPVNGTVGIDGAVTVDMNGLVSGSLPSGVKVALTNGATLTNTTGVCRMNGASSVSVGSGCTLNKYWAMGSGSMSFQDGAVWSGVNADVELSGPNTFSFKLGPTGFTPLTPSKLRWSSTKKFTEQTWTVDMADYTGPSPASIILMDFSSVADSANMTSANFLAQATRTVTNAGANAGSTIVYDPFQMAFVLKVQAAPYVAPVADLVWDGGGGSVLWTTATNWDPDLAPVAGNSMAIASAVTVDCPNVNLPACTISLMNNGAMTCSTGAVRLQGATINVASGSTLAAGFWDMNNGTINFQNGAAATMSDWELKGSTRFTFKLWSAGFTKLTPGVLRGLAGSIATSTWVVDMADYTGGPGIIPLVDYTSDGFALGMDNTKFLTSTLSVINLGVYTANLQWNNTTKAVELNITAGGNAAPTISDVSDQSIPSSSNTGALAFTVTDEDVASVTASGSSNNTTLVPNANIVFGGSGANRTVTVTPVSGLSGNATITVTLTDNGSLTAQDTFLLTVTDNYLSWATTNSVTGGASGDSDNDGVLNLIEYALVNGGERGVRSGNTITFTKRGAPYGSDVTYGILTSTDLVGWGTPGSGVTENASTISYTFTPGSPVKNFARLKVTQN